MGSWEGGRVEFWRKWGVKMVSDGSLGDWFVNHPRFMVSSGNSTELAIWELVRDG